MSRGKPETKTRPAKEKPSKVESSNGDLGFEAKLWQAADKLRNNMDAAEYKHVVLGLIFLKYISDAFEEHYSKLEREKKKGADPEDKDEYLKDNIFWVPKSARWPSLQAKAKQPIIGKLIDDAMEAIEKDNRSLKGVLPKDYGRQALNKQRLGELIDLIGTIGLGNKEGVSKDVLGRVYEYFLSEFAGAEGKNGGQFYTPKCVVKTLVEMLSPIRGRVYDPCCGSGGMFVQSERFIEDHGGHPGDISVFGQESNPTTWKLAKMNLAIRGIDANLGPENADSFQRDLHPDLKTDYILANPPFNDSDWGSERLREDKRWKFGMPPVSNANFAWVQHFIHHLAPAGTAGFVLGQISLSSESIAESEIRKGIVDADLVDCIVSLPDKLFYSTPIPVCLWLVTRNKSGGKFRDRRKQVLFIDAGNLGVSENRTHSYLTDEGISKIASAYHRWRSTDDIYRNMDGFCKSVSYEEISKGGYSLFPAKYVGAEKLAIDSGDENISIRIKGKISGHDSAREKLVAVMREVGQNMSSVFDKNGIKSPDSYIKVKLMDIFEKSDERLGERQEPDILTCTERAGLIFQKDRFAKRVATEDASKYKIVHKTDVVYNPYLLWAGAIDQCWITDLGITSPAYEVLRIKEGFDPTLIGFLIKSSKLMKMYDGISVGTVKRRRRAPVEKFLELKVMIPSKDDQKNFTRIAQALQNEMALLRETSIRANGIAQDLCKYWFGTKA